MQMALDSGLKLRRGLEVESGDVASAAILLADGATISADLIITTDGLYVGDTFSRPYNLSPINQLRFTLLLDPMSSMLKRSSHNL